MKRPDLCGLDESTIQYFLKRPEIYTIESLEERKELAKKDGNIRSEKQWEHIIWRKQHPRAKPLTELKQPIEPEKVMFT